MLKRVISESKKLGGLKSDSERLLYTWLIPWLDVEGRHSADPEIIKGHVFPKVKNMTSRKINNLLSSLNDARLINLYSANGENYLQFTKFHELQSIRKDREGESKIPAPSKNSVITPGVIQDKSRLIEVKLIEVKLIEAKDKVIDYFNKTTGQKRSYDCNETNKLIKGRLNEGKTFENFKHVIDTKTTQWLYDPKMRKFLRPSTLFREGNFEDYLNEPYENPKKKPLEIGKDKKRELTEKDKQFKQKYEKKRQEIEKKYLPKFEKAKKDGDLKAIGEAENKIKQDLAEWSNEYWKEL